MATRSSDNTAKGPKTAAPEPIVGIDLGTTNSLVAVAGWTGGGETTADDLAPRVLTDPAGGDETAMVPSVVRFEADGSVVVGRAARERAVEFPQRTVSSVKRLMGRSLADAAGDLPYMAYDVVEGEHETARVRVVFDERGDGFGDGRQSRIVSPQEVSAFILRALKDRAERSLGTAVRKAVVTVPAYFDDAQRQATRDAGRLAGLDVVRIVNEPTAAALAYGIGLFGAAGDNEHPAPRTIVVYDLGGGTFDVSVLRLTPGEDDADEGPGAGAFEVLATAGDTHLGGDDFDQALIELFTREMTTRYVAEGDPPLTFPPSTRRALREFAEATKIRLSEHDSATIQIDLGDDPRTNKPRVYQRTITREEFEALIAPLVERTLAACSRAMRDARKAGAPETADAVVLVGGSTRVPLVRRRVGEAFDIEPYTALDPDRVVALGAAVQASILAGARRDALLLDVVPLSLGIETVGGAVAKLVMRNSTVPVRVGDRFSTSVDNQTSVKLHVLQGEREMAEDCRSLGTFHLAGIPPMPAGIPKLLVTFAVDASGVLSVSAVEERSGKRAAIQIVPNHGLTRDEVDRIERDSFANARDDMTRHRVVDLVANARLDLHWINRQLDRVRDRLDPAYVEELQTAIDRLADLADRAATDWRSVDASQFHAAKQKLDELSVRVHEVSIAASLEAERAGDSK